MSYQVRRVAGYILGFALFYAPFALFQRGLSYLLTGQWQQLTIHNLCLRKPVEHLLDGGLLQFTSVSMLSLIILLAVTFSSGLFFVASCARRVLLRSM